MRHLCSKFVSKTLVTSFLFILFDVFPAPAQDFWEQTNGPEGADVRALTIDSKGDIFAGTSGDGVFRSVEFYDDGPFCPFGL